jgi:2-iminobutanoate/2-iminopropanoate deaminase
MGKKQKMDAMLKTLLALMAIGICSTQVQAAGADRTYVLPDKYDPSTSPPFSNGVLVGNTFYVAGHIGLDPATGQAAADADTEAHLVLDAVKSTLQKGGLNMDDLVSVTIYCTDLSLYDKFNAAYRGYFHEHFPARAFIGVGKLVRGAHFEIAGVALKSPHAKAAAKK